MAKEKKPKRRVIQKTETLRQRAERAANDGDKPKARRFHAATDKASKPLKQLKRFGKKSFHLPMPDNKFGRLMSKRVKFFPSFFNNAWKEVRMVEWPSAKTTARLTFAVFIFSVIFGLMIAVVDFGLDKVFRKVFLQ